jgi:hypothetical protein
MNHLKIKLKRRHMNHLKIKLKRRHMNHLKKNFKIYGNQIESVFIIILVIQF